MPQLRFSIRYDLRSVLPKGWSGTAPIQLASGNAYSSHGDFINGWTEEGGKGLVEATAENTITAAPSRTWCRTRRAGPVACVLVMDRPQAARVRVCGGDVVRCGGCLSCARAGRVRLTRSQSARP